jgi:hypothetical protein
MEHTEAYCGFGVGVGLFVFYFGITITKKKENQEHYQKYLSGKRSAYDHLTPAKISGRCNRIPTTQTQPLVVFFLLSSYFI